jgi:hypothetical protein
MRWKKAEKTHRSELLCNYHKIHIFNSTISNLALPKVQAGGIKENYRNLFMDGSNLTH